MRFLLTVARFCDTLLLEKGYERRKKDNDMVSREYIKTQIDTLPDNALERISDFIMYQRFTLGLYDDETEYVMSMPGMAQKIKDGLNAPLSECVPLSEVWNDV
jgi:hypothetical protein